MIILILLGVLALGMLGGAGLLWFFLPARIRKPEHIDYRQRWEDAVRLLGNQGQLTEEQVKQITVPQPPQVAVREVIREVPAQYSLRTEVRVSSSTARTLHSMATWDRAAIEIERAKNGKPPVDDLDGMASWDKAAVLKARAKWGTG
jgi:hypothetical protein